MRRAGMNTAVFLGGGRITAALVAGLRHAGFRGRIVVYDRHAEKLRRLHDCYAVRAEPNLRGAIRAADLLLIAVRPPDVLPLLATIAAAGPLPRRAMAVSLAAGVPLRALRRALGPGVCWARAMPSPACRNAHGLTALAFDRGAPTAARRRVHELFARVGEVMEIPEREFDAFTVVYSTSQGIHALASRIRAARKIGLSPRTASLAAAHALVEGARALAEGKASLDELLAEAATPSGIAAEVLDTMRAAAYDQIVERAYREGVARAREAGRAGSAAAKAPRLPRRS
ncbi:MAG TPA: NAD(P)-binding domain-containing protein [Candidatus Acidoferrales bacterium]|nr:NAD(P)-binding domain-containing protein [Candidatus Acidoferrales bacterium]